MHVDAATKSANDPGAARIAVIGGGITGLAAAQRLVELADAADARDVGIEVFDSAPQPGGCFGTERIGDYVIETGADSFITDKPWALDLCRRLGLESRLIGIDPRYRRALIVRKGRLWPAPEGLSLLAPTRLAGLLQTKLLSPAGKLRAAAEYFVPRRRATDDESIAAFARRRFGREMYERVVQPLVGGIYTGDPARLSLSATFPRFVEMEREWGGLIRGVQGQFATRGERATDSGVRYGLFATPREGMSELQHALRDRVLARGTVHCKTRITAIRRGLGGGAAYEIETEAGARHPADAVILALPAWRAADTLSAWAPDLGRELRSIDYASSAIVVTGHRLEDIAHPLDAAGLVIPHLEWRRILAVSFLSRKFPSRAPQGRIILRTFVGGALQPEQLDNDDDAIVRLVREELAELLGVRGEPEFVRVVRYERAMPQYELGHLQRVARIEQLVSQIGGLELAGNAYRGVR
ncbi:MAG: protoporphyrinogen oxidase [Planctomycetaceae bacterium]